MGKTKQTPEVRRRLLEVACVAQKLVYGSTRCPEWATALAEIESDGRSIVRLQFLDVVFDETPPLVTYTYTSRDLK